MGAWYAIPHSAEVKFLLVINRTLILYILHFLVKFSHTVSFSMESVLPLFPNHAYFIRECYALCIVEELGRLMLLSYPPEALSFPESMRKEVSMFEKGMVAASNDWSGDTIEGRIVRGYLVSEAMDILEYVFVGTGKGRMSKFKEGSS